MPKVLTPSSSGHGINPDTRDFDSLSEKTRCLDRQINRVQVVELRGALFYNRRDSSLTPVSSVRKPNLGTSCIFFAVFRLSC